jgi:hypothetical protein
MAGLVSIIPNGIQPKYITKRNNFMTENNLTTEILDKMTQQWESESEAVKNYFEYDREAYSDYGFYYYLEHGQLPKLNTLPHENFKP